ncbi:MAG: hypothetical protein WD738_20960 [Pirellulales bacterium]
MRRLDATCVRATSRAAIDCLRAAITLVLVGLLSATGQAGTTWDGGGSDDNWTTGANWNTTLTVPPQIPPPNNGTANIVMPAVTGLVQTPIVNVPYSINSLTFNSDGGNGRFVILGAAELTIGAGGLRNNDADIQSVIGPVKLSANQTWNAAAGRLQMDTVDLGTSDLDLAGAHPIDLIGAISGSGQVATDFGYTSTVTMSGGASNTYTDSTFVGGGTLVLQKSGGAVAVLGSSLIIASGGTVRLAADEQITHAPGRNVNVNAGALLDINTHTETLAILNVAGAVTIAAGGKLVVADANVLGDTGSLTSGQYLYVGDTGAATLDITLGGDVSSVASSFIGNEEGSVGVATVDDMGSTWTSSSLFVGAQGNGTLNITNQGRVTTNSQGTIASGEDSTSEATVDGLASGWTTGETLYVGSSGTGTLRIKNGGQVSSSTSFSNAGIIGADVGSVGVAIVQGIHSSWTSDGDLIIGEGGDGSLDISAGGLVTVTGSSYIGNESSATGEVSVDGFSSAASTWTVTNDLNVGIDGQGSLAVTSGGHVSSLYGYLGRNLGGTGEATIDGDGSKWSINNDLYVGYDGEGTLDVTGGAEVSNSSAEIGNTPGSVGTATVDGTGSLWTVTNDIDIGDAGDGSLTVANGGEVRSLTGDIADAGTSTGSVTVTGAGSMWTMADGDLRVGEDGSGTLSVEAGGRVSNRNGFIGFGPGSTGAATVDGADSQWIHSSDLTVNNGTLTVTSGGMVQAMGVLVTAPGEIHGDGSIVGTVQNNGMVAPGASSPGALSIDGDFAQNAAGELAIELSSASTYDQLLVTDNATLAGTLTVSLIDGFTPGIGQVFTILTADDVDETFDTELLPSVPNLEFNVVYNAQSVVLTVISALAGDYNSDGTVDAADYVLWRKNDGSQEGYDTWRANFGATIATGSGATAGSSSSADAAVPEPTLLALLFLTAAFGLLHHLRSRVRCGGLASKSWTYSCKPFC